MSVCTICLFLLYVTVLGVECGGGGKLISKHSGRPEGQPKNDPKLPSYPEPDKKYTGFMLHISS